MQDQDVCSSPKMPGMLAVDGLQLITLSLRLYPFLGIGERAAHITQGPEEGKKSEELALALNLKGHQKTK